MIIKGVSNELGVLFEYHLLSDGLTSNSFYTNERRLSCGWPRFIKNTTHFVANDALMAMLLYLSYNSKWNSHSTHEAHKQIPFALLNQIMFELFFNKLSKRNGSFLSVLMREPRQVSGEALLRNFNEFG